MAGIDKCEAELEISRDERLQVEAGGKIERRCPVSTPIGQCAVQRVFEGTAGGDFSEDVYNSKTCLTEVLRNL